MSNIQEANFNADPVLRDFGITFGPRGNTNAFLKVPAVSLISPEVAYENHFGEMKNGVWAMKKFTEAVNITEWIIVNMNSRTQDAEIRKLEKSLLENAGEVGMNPCYPLSCARCAIDGKNPISSSV